MVITETEEVVRQQRVNEHKTLLDMIALLDKRLVKLENAVHATGDKALLSQLNLDVAENRADLYYVQDELGRHIKEDNNGKD